MTKKQFLEFAFKEWLYMYESIVTERWAKLTVGERDLLCEEQWKEFKKDYKAQKALDRQSKKSLNT